MPRGLYLLSDPETGEPLGDERFQCAPGPTGWRYVSHRTAPDGGPAGSVDLTLDDLGRPLRLELRAGGWRVRGGTLDGLTWVRMPEEGPRQRPDGVAGGAASAGQEGHAAAHAFAGASPAFLVAAARLLRLSPGGEARRLRVVGFAPPVLAPRTRDESWLLHSRDEHPTPSGPLPVDHYRVDDLETGERREVHLAGDVVLAAPGIELEELDSPPTFFPVTTGE